jgi:hypothetical protein
MKNVLFESWSIKIVYMRICCDFLLRLTLTTYSSNLQRSFSSHLSLDTLFQFPSLTGHKNARSPRNLGGSQGNGRQHNEEHLVMTALSYHTIASIAMTMRTS